MGSIPSPEAKMVVLCGAAKKILKKKKKRKKRKENLPQLHFHNKQASVEAPEEDLKTSRPQLINILNNILQLKRERERLKNEGTWVRNARMRRV